MNKSNSGANTNTLQMIMDIVMLAVAYAIDVLVLGGSVDKEFQIGFLVLFSVFTLIYILSNKEQYLYNITMFYYLDRVYRKITKSFLLATLSTAAMMGFMPVTAQGRAFYVTFLVVAYILAGIKMFLVRPMMNGKSPKNAARTVFVGRVGQFNKFRYFLEKTSIRINQIGYIAMTREDMEQA